MFGRTIICEDLQTAAHYTRSHGLNAVTIEGDRVDRKGALTGGYHDVRRSRLDAVKAAKKWRRAYEADHARHAEVKAALQNLEQEVTRAMGQVQALEAKKRYISDGGEGLFKLLTLSARDLEQARDRVARLELSLEEAEGASKDAKAKRESYEEEFRTPMRQNLTDEELRELETLTQTVEAQKKLLFEATQSRAKVVGERNRLEIELSESLRRKKQELRDKLDRLESEAGNGELQSGEVELRRSELRNLVRDIEQLEDKVSGNYSVLKNDVAELCIQSLKVALTN